METNDVGRVLVAIGLVALAAGGVLLAVNAFGVGRLPGDIRLGSGSVRFYVPLATCIVVSIVATIVLNLIARR